MIERYLGYCPVCNGDYKAPDGLLALHGYKRPGFGYIIGDCMGAHKRPHEVSDELARAYLEILKRMEQDLQLALRDLPLRTEIREVSPFPGRPDRVYTPADGYTWERELENLGRRLQYKLDGLKFEQGRVQHLVDTWRPVPLRTVRESEEQNTRERAERRQVIVTERAEKTRKLIAGIQARIDTAVRNQTMSSLASIYDSAIHNLPEKLRTGWGRSVTNNEALAALERDHVWTAFGLPLEVPPWKSAERGEVEKILSSMRYPEYDKQPREWPAELGTPKKKRARR